MTTDGEQTVSGRGRRPASWRTTALIAAAALVLGGVLGGIAGAALGGIGPSQDLLMAQSELTASQAELEDAKSQAADLTSDIDDLRAEVDELSAQVPAPADAPAASRGSFPEGYPYVVAVSELPDQVRSWYEMGPSTEAVALAPGVWTELPPGADMQAAIDARIADGFCASVEAYKRDYAKSDLAGTCW